MAEELNNSTVTEESRDERADAKQELIEVLSRQSDIIHRLARDSGKIKAADIKRLADEYEKRARVLISVLMKKRKREARTGSKNLTNPCVVSAAFSKYVGALHKGGSLGSVTGDAAVALTAITNKGISSLLVNTLLLSADNYNQPKQEGVTFRVTGAMKTHLGAYIKQVTAQRAQLNQEDPDKQLFNPANYDSALNNVLAASVREKEASKTRKSELDDAVLTDQLAALQAHLKAHNASLRDSRK